MRRRATTASNRGVDVLVVCTGNICRSPYLEARLRDALPELRFESAGTAAVVGSPPDPHIVTALQDKGIPGAESLRATSLTGRRARSAQLIITATHQHRLEVIRADRSAEQRTFTLKELARLSETLRPGAGVNELLLVAQAAAAEPGDRDFDDDLADPYGLDDAAYRRMMSEADAALDRLVRVL